MRSIGGTPMASGEQLLDEIYEAGLSNETTLVVP
jgi:hypothetical protein